MTIEKIESQPTDTHDGDMETPIVVTKDQLRKLIIKQKDGAPGPNGIPFALFKENPDLWAAHLEKVFNEVIKKGVIPESWRGSLITPIYKKGNWALAENYRLITLQDTDAKLFARILLNELSDWATESKILPLNQTGFIKGLGTSTNILALSLIMDKSISLKQPLYLCFVDFKSAFDCVQRNLLWKNLREKNIPTALLKMIQLLYSKTWVRVRMGDGQTLSKEIPANEGLKQGCVLAPFFLIYSWQICQGL